MNLKQAITLTAEKLALLKDIDAPTFESEVLLRYCLNLDRAALHLNLKKDLSQAESSLFFDLIERRCQGEPTSYIIGRREFYGLDFMVDRRVLIPRPETELLVEEALKLIKTKSIKSIVDVGTGSGAIAVSLAVNLCGALRADILQIDILASDISPQALEVARANAQKQGVENRITFLQGDLLEPFSRMVDIIIANLPYVSSTEVNGMPSAQYEPQTALDGGEYGLDHIYRLANQIKGKLNPGGFVLLEIGMGQAKAVSEYLGRILPEAKIDLIPDLAGIERVVKVALR